MVVFENGKIKIGKSLPIFGVLMIVAGVWTWCHPDAVLLAMALYVGIVFLAGGIGYVHSFFQTRSGAWLAIISNPNTMPRMPFSKVHFHDVKPASFISRANAV